MLLVLRAASRCAWCARRRVRQHREECARVARRRRASSHHRPAGLMGVRRLSLLLCCCCMVVAVVLVQAGVRPRPPPCAVERPWNGPPSRYAHETPPFLRRCPASPQRAHHFSCIGSVSIPACILDAADCVICHDNRVPTVAGHARALAGQAAPFSESSGTGFAPCTQRSAPAAASRARQ